MHLEVSSFPSLLRRQPRVDCAGQTPLLRARRSLLTGRRAEPPNIPAMSFVHVSSDPPPFGQQPVNHGLRTHSARLQAGPQMSLVHQATGKQQPFLDVVQEPGRTRVTRSGRPKSRFRQRRRSSLTN